MAGAIAGTTILRLRTGEDRLRVVAATVNNVCNLRCPHCYLQYAGPSGIMSDDVAQVLMDATYDHLAVVGKEPLLDHASVALCESLVTRALSTGKSASIITNGFGLSKLSCEASKALAYVDVSFDGGPQTYGSYRLGAYAKLTRSVEAITRAGIRELNALHVLNNVTVHSIDDMMRVTEIAPFRYVMFSPYLVTRNFGENSVSEVPLTRILSGLARSEAFRSTASAVLVVDSLHLTRDGSTAGSFLRDVAAAGLADQVRVIDRDPLEYGVIRITYDGWLLAPHDSIHPTDYAKLGRRIHEGEKLILSAAYDDMLRAFRRAA